MTTACTAGLKQLEQDPVFQLHDGLRQNMCEGPYPDPKAPTEYAIRCNGTRAWADACSNAGGDVCAMNAKGHGKYGGTDPVEHDYIVYSLLCIPLSCKKDENIKEYIWEQTKVWCPTYGFKACSMSVTCGHVPSKMTGPIVLALFGFLLLVGGILCVVYFVYTRIYANRAQSIPEVPAGLGEYSELAQYEEEDEVAIEDDSINTLQNDEEEHPL